MTSPTSIGRFRIEAALGGGSFGTVYRAYDPLVGEMVAIKVLRPELGRDGEQMERLRREVVLARRVDHPGVCRIHDLQKDGDTLFVVMQLVDGETLDNICARGPLPPLRAVRIIEQVCRALAAAHAVGVLHRDIKPSNVMVKSGDDDDVKLVDFGIATTQGLDHLTKPGVALGTVGYLAPELWEGDAATPVTDVFAAGVVLYGTLTGRLPWRATGLAVLQQMRSVPAAPPSIFAGASASPRPASTRTVDAGLDAIVMKSIAIEPLERFQSAVELADALRSWTTGAVDTPRPREPAALDDPTREVRDTAPEPIAAPRTFRGALVTAATIGALAFGGALFAWPSRDAAKAIDALVVPAIVAAPAVATPPANTNEAVPLELDVAPTLEPSIELDVEPSIEGAGTTRKLSVDADTRKTMALRTELGKLLEKRGLVVGDVPAVDAALRMKARDPKAAAALESALEKAKATDIDRAFVERKLARLQSRAGSSSSPELSALAGGIAADISARRYAAANGRLNRALALVR